MDGYTARLNELHIGHPVVALFDVFGGLGQLCCHHLT